MRFEGVEEIKGRFFDCEGWYRDFYHALFWKDKGRDYVLLVITSGENKYSQLAFSYKRVVFEDLGSKFYPSYVGICKNKVGKVCDKRKKTRKKNNIDKIIAAPKIVSFKVV